MEKDVLFVGIDVDDKAYHVAIVDEKGKEVIRFMTDASPQKLVSKLRKVAEGRCFKVCYEATYIGYSLQRALNKSKIECEVIAPSLIPTLPGKKVKTDKLDSLALARYYSQGLLTVISIPDEELEGDRSLLRTRVFVYDHAKRIKNHISSYAKRLGWDYRRETKLKSYWTMSHRIWLDRKIATLNSGSLQATLRHLLALLKSVEASLAQFSEEIEEVSEKTRHKAKVNALKCLRGMDTTAALTVVLEIGDAQRFDHPRRLASYAGLDVIEHSSGGKERKFGISKMGNTHLRRVLVESCQFAIAPPRISRGLASRREGVDPKIVEIADRCMNRLHKKSSKLLYRDKPRNKIKTACAREMLGFIWELLTKAA